MKNFMKAGVSFLLFIYMICMGTVFANSSIDCGKVFLKSESTKVENMKNDISRKENLNILGYSYLSNVDESDYKYIVWKKIVTYFNSVTKESLGIVTIESRFRYNSATKKCECLSSSASNVCDDSASEISTFSRRRNNTTDIGGCKVKLKFKNKGVVYDNFKYDIECDYLGNIILRE